MEEQQTVDMSARNSTDPLFVDLYELTMAQAYLQSGQTGHATFSLYFRNFPANRTYYVFCGLESVIRYLEDLRFSQSDIDASRQAGPVRWTVLLDYLSAFEFTGSVRAMREGEIFFPNEPVIEVSGPIIECQIAETFLINQINLESMLATKAARVVEAAGGRQVVDFASRRTHGPRRGPEIGQGILHRWLRRNEQRSCRINVRHTRGGHDGPLVHIHVRFRGCRIQQLRQFVSGIKHVPR